MKIKKNKVKMLAAALGVAIIVGLTGCSGKSLKDLTSGKEYTYEKFSKVKTGMTYEQTENILGKGKLSSSDYGIKIYKWTNKDSSEIQVSYGTDKKATTKSETNLEDNSVKVTKADYDKIDGKQKYEDIKSLLGGEGTITEVTDSGNGNNNTYIWGNKKSGYIKVSFVQGYASFKSGQGLK
ncbi:hypothetical protein [Clostridium felsineum]|uniref:Uncharacterized protein n=1 Tax=Clostridium felsineum TaxID=36839 RepID=A0A1S8KZ07_9CLOT|nr:hypothetical protein [Clostridium felsineum]URZ03951.1 hypothetical protein CLAUR_040170 [Clostridium felsineum]URZ07785.1 hypothetical protein CLROS_031460 [Clostridium felsineum]URZ12816.1 hypothetical protein CROST_035610 [Clostridium felsineum]